MRVLIIKLIAILLIPLTAYAYVPTGNGAYVYDFKYDTAGHKKGHQPGLFATEINEYNRAADNGHRITQLFTYAGDMEMSCRGSSGSRRSKPCESDDLMIFYINGSKSTKAYFASVNATTNPADIIPVVDGRVDTHGKYNYLRGLNKLTQQEAILYADKVATLFCKDKRVSGVQFDIEPFDIQQKGQLYFYQQIAKDFAGKDQHCVDEIHTKGRFFSVFTNSYGVDADVGKVLNQYENGYVVDALYDLGSNENGVALSPEEYKHFVSMEIINMLSKAKQYQVKFQLILPVAATEHEFTSRSGKPSGYQQLDYIKTAFSVMNEEKIRENINFLGVDLWAYTERMMLSGHDYKPAKPDEKVRAYLMKNL